MKRFAYVLVTCAALGTISPVSATTLFQSIADLTAIPNTNAWCSTCFVGSRRVFDQFSLSASANITSATFAVQTSFFFPTSVDLSVWTSAANQPVTQLFNQTFGQGDFVSIVNTAFDTSIVTVNLTGLALTAGIYEISFFNPNNLGIPGYTGGSGLLFQQGGGFTGESAAFALFDSDVIATPLPAALQLFATGLGIIGLIMQRRKRARI